MIQFRDKNMRFPNIIRGLTKNKFSGKYKNFFIGPNSLFGFKSNKLYRNVFTTPKTSIKFVHTVNGENEEETLEDPELLDAEIMKENDFARNLLFKNSTDPVIIRLNKCVSVDDILNTFNRKAEKYTAEHLTQTVLVLQDLQKMFCIINGDGSAKEFVQKLYERSEFHALLQLIQDKIDDFSSNNLSYLHLYLSKLGISVEDEIMQKLAVKVRDDLLDDFSLEKCSRFLTVIFTEYSVRPYYLAENLIPKIFEKIDTCEYVEDFEHLTTCLNKLYKIITEETLEKYKKRLKFLIETEKLGPSQYKRILKILLLLNYPHWRQKNSKLMAECILLIQSKIDVLTFSELTLLYQIFFKIQEPGLILNNIQRCSSKYLQSDDILSTHIDTRLKLFSSLIYFSSPTHRIQFRKLVENYVKECHSANNLILLRKILSYIKINDEKLCETYWKNMLKLLKEENNLAKVLIMCENYMNFNIDIDNYRCPEFEAEVMARLEKLPENFIAIFPSKLCQALCFSMVYGNNLNLVEHLMEKIHNNYTQINHIDCFKISQALHLLLNNSNRLLTLAHRTKIYEIIRKATKHMLQFDTSLNCTDYLLKGNVLRYDTENVETEMLLMKYKEVGEVSSKMLENVAHFFKVTNSLIPEVINKLTDYVIVGTDHILGFNAEKILYLCYYLGYFPYNADKLFETVTNIIIRDQERLSGLSFLQSALALCFFNKLPNSFIKLIFNVEFLEKLDAELANCYSKDKYPQRVRHSLMQLNRAVCLEYPQSNVPWFHQKYIEEKKKVYYDKDKQISFNNIRDNLILILQKPELISENFLTPYGYQIDFLLNLDDKNDVVEANSNNIKTKLAILLMRHKAFTKFYIQLRGKYQFKKRHLEMLGYQVAIINVNDWINLLYAREKVEFIANLIWPEDQSRIHNLIRR